MLPRNLKIAFYGSSLVSAYWNGAATYYRGILKYLNSLGHDITFYEPDAFNRQQHRDITDPDYANVVVYPPTEEDVLEVVIKGARNADVMIKASGVGVHDDLLLETIAHYRSDETLTIFWDVDAPETLAAINKGEERTLKQTLSAFDAVFTYGGGEPVIRGYRSLGVKTCLPIYNGVDPDTHHRVKPDSRFACDLAFLGNRLPDREKRVEEFLIKPALLLPEKHFLLGGSGWEDKKLPPNITSLGHIYTDDHNILNVTARSVLNICRDSMARNGYSPATRLFEAAGAGACIITDEWPGIGHFFEPQKEILVARSGNDVVRLLSELDSQAAKHIGNAAMERALREHTYPKRAIQVEQALLSCLDRKLSGKRHATV